MEELQALSDRSATKTVSKLVNQLIDLGYLHKRENCNQPNKLQKPTAKATYEETEKLDIVPTEDTKLGKRYVSIETYSALALIEQL
jgi:hypothetical protein